ncbi:DUF6402 family protein [Dyella sp. 333MFSha]|uniref:DUF6402 family protein n=1 Tax=Dyella sp. 333MFSha TaxID=1798240 RepID=UPI00088AB0F9|nr:DUF6402 family protein [Dyella sp. 333MFSha]SDG75670.1 hypothetical protein SAMN04515659_3438 [Dyella sp. 333MFSha]
MNGNPAALEDATSAIDKVESIPRAMRHVGWMVAADLMERWLHSSAWVLPDVWKSPDAPDPRTLPASSLDERIVRMSWAMANPRVRIGMERLREKMANGPAKKLLQRRATKLSWGANGRADFGSQHDSAVQLDWKCQSNYEVIGGKLDTMDDLYGALGSAALKVALVGEATRDAQNGKISLRVTHAGFYIRDTYDFNGPQTLGTWTKDGVLNKKQIFANAVMNGLSFQWGIPSGHVSNADFEQYRIETGLGGDFVIYSDVYWERTDFVLDLG